MDIMIPSNRPRPTRPKEIGPPECADDDPDFTGGVDSTKPKNETPQEPPPKDENKDNSEAPAGASIKEEIQAEATDPSPQQVEKETTQQRAQKEKVTNANPREQAKNDINLNDSDIYGAELGKDARVWKVYVQEADRHDTDLVYAWNK
ncbi:unnamed protein product [Rhizoctonia solani]|uniref:Uncharacterized protein n=1 Tax=Rhizoctonia solani TaxID=456999 RepID=A0A8H3GV38_9AGAM|nr:unnamed protein product [Rhizoctonia solani]